MSKRQLAEFALIAIAMLMLFKAFEAALNLITYTLYYVSNDMGGNGSFFMTTIAYLVVYIAGFLVLIKKRDAVLNAIVDKTESEMLPIKTNLQELLYIVLIALGIITMFSTGTKLVSYAIDYFTTEVSSGLRERIMPPAFKENAIEFILAFLMLYFARPLSQYFSKRNEPLKLEFDKPEESA